MKPPLVRLSILICAIWCFAPALRAQYTLKLRSLKIDTLLPVGPDKGSEWLLPVHVDVFDANKNLLPPSDSTYRWYQQDPCTPTNPAPSFGPWPDRWNEATFNWDGNIIKTSSDCCSSCFFQSYWVFATVEVEGTIFYSDTIRVPDEGLGYIVWAKERLAVDQKRENQTTAGFFGRKRGGAIYNYPAPDTFWVVPTTTEVLRGSQGLVPNTSDKYNRWENDNNIVNHKSFTIVEHQPTLKSLLKTATNPTIRTWVAEGGFVAATVDFKDPWLMDDYSDGLGPRNRGTNAVFVSKSTPFYPLNDGNTKGVFTGQTVASGNYYSLRAVQPIHATGLEWNFSSWTYSNANVSSPTSLETQVVFNSGAQPLRQITTLSSDRNFSILSVSKPHTMARFFSVGASTRALTLHNTKSTEG